MTRVRLYCPELSKHGEAKERNGLTVVALSQEESHHAMTVLRCRRGDAVVLFDGLGREAPGEITQADRRRVLVTIGPLTEHPFDCAYPITLAVAVGKAHRQSYLVEKCTELGVAAIWPMISEHSVTHPKDAAVEKWSRRAVEAAKQSGRRWAPVVEPPQSFGDVLARAGGFAVAAIAHPDAKARAFLDVLSEQPAGSSILVCVGPEGGWSNEECERAGQFGAVPVWLAPTVLRVETAAVAACAAAALLSVSGGQLPERSG